MKKNMKQSLNLLQAFANGLRQLVGESIEKIILIGSYARGDQTPESDIDIVILLKASSKNLRDKIYDYLVDFTLEHDVDISLKLINRATYQEWKEWADPFVKSIETEGVEV
jgi:predicted nucleotidyltransferase